MPLLASPGLSSWEEHAGLWAALLYALGRSAREPRRPNRLEGLWWRRSPMPDVRPSRRAPPHPGAAEGFSFLSAVAGLAVLGFQLAEYGYLPEAVPIAGGVCSNL